MQPEQSPTIIWDFDRTLAYRPAERHIMLQILDECDPGHPVTIDRIRPYLLNRFPWQSPEHSHPELSTPEKWWTMVEKLFAEAYTGAGIAPAQAKTYARLVHERYIRPDGFVLYDDAIPALEQLAERGWRHMILTNHMPDIPNIVRGLGLGRLISHCLTSAAIGYEKPHPQAFHAALEAAGHPQQIWMVGDNYKADFCGALSVGLAAILVHHDRLPPDAPPGPCALTLLEAARIIDQKSTFDVRSANECWERTRQTISRKKG